MHRDLEMVHTVSINTYVDMKMGLPLKRDDEFSQERKPWQWHQNKNQSFLSMRP